MVKHNNIVWFFKIFFNFLKMKIINILLLFALAANSFVEGSPTEEYELERQGTKIVGGTTVDIKQYPYQVSLQYEGQHFCGGSIIHIYYVLTAAHCVRDAGNMTITIRAGSSFWETQGTVIRVEKIFIHPKYAKETKQDYDVAVLQLKTALTCSNTIKVVPLQKVEVKDGILGAITGWGLQSETGSPPKQLMATNINVVNRKTCAGQYATKNFVVTDRMICATAPNKDTCYGDSGGPYVSNGYQIGITSWGYGCARNEFPGVYTNIAHNNILSWIRNFIENFS